VTDLLAQAPRFRAEFFQREGELMQRLARDGQAPEAMFVACSDSRVVPEFVTGARPGDLFVLRNVGNVIPPFGTSDAGVGAVIEYAIRHLPVRHVVLCGHLDCGAVRLLDGSLDMAREPALAQWLEWIRPAQAHVDAQNLTDPAERHRAIVRTNVKFQLANLQSYDSIRRALKADELELHGWVFDIETGRVWSYDPGEDLFRLVE
jgi:carbonic anhydrase